LLSLLLFLGGQGEWRYLCLSALLLADACSNLAFVTVRIWPYVPTQLLIQAEGACLDVALWLLLLSIFGLDQSRRWRVCTAVVIAVYLVASLADCVVIFFWRFA
jgi:hypothetical protein